MICGGNYKISVVLLAFLALQLALCNVPRQAQAKPCLAALQRTTSNRKAGIADILKPICDVNGFYKLGYYCGAFRCFCVVDKYGRNDFKISRDNCNKQQKTTAVGCVNTNVHCNAWTQKGNCHTGSQYRAFMMKYCKKACCANYNKSCSFWASNGECANNPLYMYKNCKGACYACTC